MRFELYNVQRAYRLSHTPHWCGWRRMPDTYQPAAWEPPTEHWLNENTL